MIKKIILVASLATMLFSQTASEYKAQQMQGFSKYKTDLEKEFKAYQEAQNKAFNDYK